MQNISKSQLERILKNVSKGLDAACEKKESGYYASLYPDDFTEGNIARSAVKFPELHPLMIEVAQKIIAYTSGTGGHLWENEEEQAGSQLTLELALYDKKYCAFFARCLLFQDLNHEVYQNEYITDIISKWGICDETAIIVHARQDNPGQWGDDLISELMDEYGDTLAKYLDDDDDCDDEDGEDDDSDEEENRSGSQIMIQDKRTLEMVSVNWQEGYPYLVVTHHVNQMKAFHYGTYAQVEQIVSELEYRCGQSDYGWQKQQQPPMAETLVRGGIAIPAEPVDIFHLFTPAGQPTALDKLNHEYFEGYMTVACQKVQLYKGFMELVILIADPSGCRILNPVGYESQYLWIYESADEMCREMDRMVQGYLAEGYELVLEETLEYAFDRSLELTQQTALTLAQQDDDSPGGILSSL